MKTVKYFMLSLILLCASSCTVATLVAGGSVDSFEGMYDLPLKENETKSISDLRSALTELGFKSSSNYDLTFTKQNSMIEGIGLSSVNSNYLPVEIYTDKFVLKIM